MSVAAHEQRSERSAKGRIAGTLALLAGWVALYASLRPASEWAVRQVPIDPASALGGALEFFIYETPKVLLLLTLVAT